MSTDQTNQPTTEPDALDLLEAQALAMEASTTNPAQALEQQQAEQAQAEIMSMGQELAATLEVVREMITEAADEPQLRDIWSDQRLTAIGAAGAMVMQRHGFTLAGFMGTWGPYIALVGSLLPPGLATFKLVQLRKAEAAARRAQLAQVQQQGATPEAVPA